MKKIRNSLLKVEQLEDRCTPTLFGYTWSDAGHLTASFTGNTSVLGVPSTLTDTLNAQMPTATWQNAIARALQTWSEVANISISIVPDGNQVIGGPGASQGDARFGDIRFGAIDMAPSELAEAVTPNPLVSGTLAGDIFFNRKVTFTANSLYGVALHEVGHALGLAPSTDPNSVMFNAFNQNLVLSAGDVSNIQALYGTRSFDLDQEGTKGNDDRKRAAEVDETMESGTYNGSTPMVAWGDISSATDVDFYSFRNLSSNLGPISIRLQTAGLSLLNPKMTIYDRSAKVVATLVGTPSLNGSVLNYTLPSSIADATYYIKVEGNSTSTFAKGRFALGVTFQRFVKPLTTSLEQVLRGPYDQWNPEHLDEVFLAPSSAILVNDLGQDNTFALATNLNPAPGFADRTKYQTISSLHNTTDIDYFRFRAPANGATTFTFLASVRPTTANGLIPKIRLFDESNQLLPSSVLLNGNGTFTLQANGVQANRRVYAEITGNATGNYVLEGLFLTAPVPVTQFSSVVVPTGATYSTDLFIARTQFFGFTVNVAGAANTSAQISILNASGQTVWSATANGGQTVSGDSALLAPGAYRVRITSTGGPATVAIDGNVQSDPIGPQGSDSTIAPQYVNPTGGGYIYPNGVLTLSEYNWSIWQPGL